MDTQSERLLAAWLRLSGIINNQRLVKGLSFNQALVCGLLARAQGEGRSLTAKELCRETRILKSQMNTIVRSLERAGYLQGQPSVQDRRQVELRLLPEGMAAYQASHRRSLAMVDRLIASLGREQAELLIPMLRQAADIFDCVQQEV